MSGIFGIVSNENCVLDLFYGTFYLQHRAQDYCGLALCHNGELKNCTHKGLVRQQFSKEKLKEMCGTTGIGCVASERQPVSELSVAGGMILCFDGNISNYLELKESLLRRGISFSGYLSPEEVSDTVLISKIIAKEANFEKGIKRMVELIKGDFAIIALTKEGIYAARGWGRKPLILGKKGECHAVSSESVSFVNLGFGILRDVSPGEIVLIDKTGVRSIAQLDLQPSKYCTFEWVYTSNPSSVIEGTNVASARIKIGSALAEKYPAEVDLVSPIPNSGRWHSIGYAKKSGLPHIEVFLRYDYSDRSYTPKDQEARNEEAKTKLIPLKEMINGKKIIIVDDSIVRGTQMLNRVETLKELGAKEVHARIACPPLMAACKYGKTTKKDDDCIARRMLLAEIKRKLKLDSLEYASEDDLERAIGIPKEKLCLECWQRS
jgi:amidophosphoribosyltransferase